jgi:NurA domain
MLHSELLNRELEEKGEEFGRYLEKQREAIAFYVKTLANLENMPSADIERRLASLDNPAAIPSKELNGSFTFSFEQYWQNHEQARAWAMEVLKDRVTFAADGSQLYLEKETSLPIGAVQIGWFENPHNGSTDYEKNAKFQILLPETLLLQGEPVIPERRVGEIRMEEEIGAFRQFLTRRSGWQARGERMPLAFFDGTLLLSDRHPEKGMPANSEPKLLELLNLSRETRVPLVGFIDRSFARDIVSTLDALEKRNGNSGHTLYDSSVLGSNISDVPRVLKKWGERTAFCFSKRRGLDKFIDAATERSIAGFTYLQTTSSGGPARLDVPAWVFDDGLINEVIDVVRAECVVGLGYPYAIESADHASVISSRDREKFLQALQGFAVREKLGFNVARKAASKDRRR